MCRVLAYLGDPTELEPLLYDTDNSLIKQSYAARFMQTSFNLAGFGLAAWTHDSFNSEHPFIYRSAKLPFYEENLKNLSMKLKPHCFIAHVRGVALHSRQVIEQRNAHPFMFPGTDIAFAHNGFLSDFYKMRYDILNYVKPDVAQHIRGTTDSEWIYALILSQCKDPFSNISLKELVSAVKKSIDILRKIREKLDLHYASGLNFFISNSHFILATRMMLNYGHFEMSDEVINEHLQYKSLWYTFGEKYIKHENEYQMALSSTLNKAIVIASEPLTQDTTTWVEVPEYTLMYAWRERGTLKIEMQDIQ